MSEPCRITHIGELLDEWAVIWHCATHRRVFKLPRYDDSTQTPATCPAATTPEEAPHE